MPKREAQTIEFKSSWQEDYFVWLSGYANADGGTLYIGVNDDGYPANPLIGDGLFFAGAMDTWGQGFQLIREECEKIDAPLPEIKATEKYVTVTIRGCREYMKRLGSTDSKANMTDFADSTDTNERDVAYTRMLEILSRELKENEKKKMLPLVDYFKNHDEISAADAAAVIGMSLPTATRYLKRMIQLEVIVRVGESHNTRYCLMMGN